MQDSTKSREGYCVDCKNNPEKSIVEASKEPDSPCYGCWFHEEKINWAPVT